eukprot:11722104-Prorocentrum_lima.AAC.1
MTTQVWHSADPWVTQETQAASPSPAGGPQRCPGDRPVGTPVAPDAIGCSNSRSQQPSPSRPQ